MLEKDFIEGANARNIPADVRFYSTETTSKTQVTRKRCQNPATAKQETGIIEIATDSEGSWDTQNAGNEGEEVIGHWYNTQGTETISRILE